jgi:hypothetical protein
MTAGGKKKNEDPLDIRAGNPSQNSRLRAATANQGSVSPEDYPEEKRQAQVASSDSHRAPGKSRADESR